MSTNEKKTSKRATTAKKKRPKAGQRGAQAKKVKDSVRSEGVGGDSNLLQDSRHVREDMRLAGLAVRKRWPTEDRIKEAISAKVARVTLAADDERITLMGARVYVQMEGQNQADEHKAQPDKVDLTITESPEDRVASVLARLRGEIKRQAPSGREKANGAKK